MTKEEKAALDANTKELKSIGSELRKLVRQMEIRNVIAAKEQMLDLDEVISEMDNFETKIKQHSIDINIKKKGGND